MSKHNDYRIVPIKSDADYEAVMVVFDELWGSAGGTPEGDLLDVLATLIEAYEIKRWPMPAPSPIDAIEFRMERKG